MTEIEKIKKNISIALFAAFMAIGAFIKIPVGPVPISLTSFFLLLAAILLGPKGATFSVIIYLIAGSLGLPVFAGGSGPAVFAGPTGGFLLAYIPAAIITGVISSKNEKTSSSLYIIIDFLAVFAGTIILYIAGVAWLKWRLNISWSVAIISGVLPFLLVDAIKAVSVVLIRKFLLNYSGDILPAR